jgi:hypothetical protein
MLRILIPYMAPLVVACGEDWRVRQPADAGDDSPTPANGSSDLDAATIMSGPHTGTIRGDGSPGADDADKDTDSATRGGREVSPPSIDASAMLDSGAQDASIAGASMIDAGTPDAGCARGYSLLRGTCVDIDECSEGSAMCHPSSKCMNSNGGYDCTCREGYAGGGPNGIACAPRVSVGAAPGGAAHFCATRPNGEVVCWGNNNAGQIGDGTTTDGSSPTPVSGLADAAFAAAGNDANCAVMRDGTVRCWGKAAGSQWSYGSLTPVALGGLKDSVQLPLGAAGCAVDRAGSVFCWGGNGEGQVGNGQATGIPVVRPTVVGGLAAASWVTASATQPISCAALRSGAMFCWGKGMLTSAQVTSSNLPVSFSAVTDAVQVQPMTARTCALGYNGEVTCWGNPPFIADDSSGPAWLVSDATGVTGGLYQTCVTKSPSGLSCWNIGTQPTHVDDADDVLAVAADGARTYGLTAGGKLKFWNMNSTTPVRQAASDIAVW